MVLPPVISGGVQAVLVVAAITLGLGLVGMIAWILAGDRSGLTSVFDLVSYGWLAASGVPIVVRSAAVWLIPLGLSAALVWFIAYTTKRSIIRARIRNMQAIGQYLGGGAVTFALLGLVVGWLSQGSHSGAVMWWIPLATAITWLLGAALGVIWGLNRWTSLVHRIPAYLRADLRAALGGLAVLAMGSAVLLILSIALNWSQVNALVDVIKPGFSGSVALVLLSLAYLPTAIVWSASYAVGIGFSVGVGQLVNPWVAPTAELPAFPLLAAIPPQGAWWHAVVMVLPVAAASFTVRLRPLLAYSWQKRLLQRARTAGIAGLIALVAGLLSMGTFGGALSGLGANPLLLSAAVAAWWLLVAAAAEAMRIVRNRNQPHQIDLRMTTEVESAPLATDATER